MTNSLQHQAEILRDRYGLKLASRLSDGAEQLPYEVSERLRAARVRAVAQRKVLRLQAAPAMIFSGGVAALTSGDDGLSLWNRIASALPVIALVVGLITINSVSYDTRAVELAEVDAALLTDDLPPSAYADPGFAQFLKASAQAEE